MIKNIVFDLGNVLISFKPSEYLDKKNYPANLKEKILKDIFGSKEWLMLDNGDITTSEAIDSILRHSSLKREEIIHVFNHRTELMYPREQNARILPDLRKRGFKLYYLSNTKSVLYFLPGFQNHPVKCQPKSRGQMEGMPTE